MGPLGCSPGPRATQTCYMHIDTRTGSHRYMAHVHVCMCDMHVCMYDTCAHGTCACSYMHVTHRAATHALHTHTHGHTTHTTYTCSPGCPSGTNCRACTSSLLPTNPSPFMSLKAERALLGPFTLPPLVCSPAGPDSAAPPQLPVHPSAPGCPALLC